MSRRLTAAVAIVIVAIAAGSSSESHSAAGAGVPPLPQRSNFVFVLTDDLSYNLLRYMPQVQAMRRQGTSFSRYFVTDSLCCPSRSTIFTGRYPHSTGVITNGGSDGGFRLFHGRGEERDTFATSLQAAPSPLGQGYATAMMGKYLNGYTPRGMVDGKPRYVPPGWSAWSVAGNGYPNYDYNLLQKTVRGQPRVVHYGHSPQDYLTRVISRRGRGFIRASVTRRQPFMLELATFIPHGPYTPDPLDARKFPNARAPRSRIFNRPQAKPRPRWLTTRRLSKKQIAAIDRHFRMRAQAVQSVDRMIGAIRAELRNLGVADNTYIAFSSDNGYHMGQRRMGEGKQTAWDHDIRVPLVVIGPGVRGGQTVAAIAANTDLRPTFQQLADVPTGNRVEGRSLVPLLRGDQVSQWRSVVLIEHHGPNRRPSDPDHATRPQGNPPSYKALRFAHSLWVQYDDPRYRSEYYNLRKDPLERHNVAGKLSRRRRAHLLAVLRRYASCSDGLSCQTADRAQSR